MSEALQIGTQLVKLCQAGKADDAMETLYDEKIVSIEGQGSDEMPARIEGIEAVRGKSKWWYDNHDVHALDTQGPFVGHREDQFAVRFDLDVTFKPSGERSQMREIGLYTVENGRVIQEEFLYLMA